MCCYAFNVSAVITNLSRYIFKLRDEKQIFKKIENRLTSPKRRMSKGSIITISTISVYSDEEELHEFPEQKMKEKRRSRKLFTMASFGCFTVPYTIGYAVIIGIDGCNGVVPIGVSLGSSTSVAMLALLGCLYILRHAYDPLLIRFEVFVSSVLIGFSIIGVVLQKNFVVVIFMFLNFVFLTYVQFFFALKTQRKNLLITDIEVPRILEYRRTHKMFMQHCISEISSENVLFWDSVQDYLRSFENRSYQKNLEIAQDIFDEFVKRGSDKEINIPYKVSNKLRKAFGTPPTSRSSSTVSRPGITRTEKLNTIESADALSFMERAASSGGRSFRRYSTGGTSGPSTSIKLSDVFNDALSEVISIMQRDTLPRFMASKYWTIIQNSEMIDHIRIRTESIKRVSSRASMVVPNA
jgi:hypothetical protein